MSLTILQVIQEYSNAGGAETVAFELSQALSRLGALNEVLASRIDGEPTPPTIVHPIARALARVPTRGAFRHIGRLAVVPLFSFVATLAARPRPGHVVISHGDCMRGDVMVIHAVNAASLDVKRAEGNWRWRLNPLHYWVALRDRHTIGGLRFRRYIAVSHRVEQELQHYFNVPGERIRIIPNGIDLSRFTPRPEARDRIRAAWGIPADARVLMFCGHEFHRKGLEYLVRALAFLDPRYWVLVVGSDDPAPYRDLVPDARERIVFAGAQRNMTDFYAAADAFVFPTNYETFSLVCMEALACGVPVLATRVGGIEDYLKEGENGYFIDRNPEQIADRVRATFADAAHYQALRAGALATAANYHWDHIATLYLGMIDELQADASAARPTLGSGATGQPVTP